MESATAGSRKKPPRAGASRTDLRPATPWGLFVGGRLADETVEPYGLGTITGYTQRLQLLRDPDSARGSRLANCPASACEPAIAVAATADILTNSGLMSLTHWGRTGRSRDESSSAALGEVRMTAPSAAEGRMPDLGNRRGRQRTTQRSPRARPRFRGCDHLAAALDRNSSRMTERTPSGGEQRGANRTVLQDSGCGKPASRDVARRRQRPGCGSVPPGMVRARSPAAARAERTNDSRLARAPAAARQARPKRAKVPADGLIELTQDGVVTTKPP